MCVFLTLERLVVAAAVWRTVVSLLVAVWGRGVAVLSAMLVSVQTVTEGREESV